MKGAIIMSECFKKPWDLSSYIDCKSNYVLEIIDTCNNSNKYWIHLYYVNTIGYLSKYRDSSNHQQINKKFKQNSSDAFKFLMGKYIPIDSTLYRIGKLIIPKNAVGICYDKTVSNLKNKMGDYISNHNLLSNQDSHKGVYLEFIFKDNNGNKNTVSGGDIPLDNDNGLQLFN